MKTEFSLGDLDNPQFIAGGLRTELNVNSPKSDKPNGFKFGTPDSLITQVKPEDEAQQMEIARRISKRLDEERGAQESLVSKEKSQKSKSYWRCFSYCLCAGKGTHYAREDDESSEDEHNNETRQSDERNNETRQSDSSDALEAVEANDNESESSDNCDALVAVEGKFIEPTYPQEDNYVIELIQPEKNWLLKPAAPSDIGRKCLVLDLDETLVHSKFEPIECSFSFPIIIEGTQHGVYVLKRPFVDEFIAECAKMYELVVFTASLPNYANPVIDRLDKNGLIKHRLFRGDCVFYEEKFYVKDLSMLGRDMKDCIIIDNSMLSFLFNPTNAIFCTSWYGDKSDTELLDLLPVLSGALLATDDVRKILDGGNQSCRWLIKTYGDKTYESETSSW